MSLSLIELFALNMRDAIKGKLPGLDAQFIMAPQARKENYPNLTLLRGHIESAVCVHFYEKNNRICFPVIERVESNGVHSKQMALPGGRMDLKDYDFISCALRETREEIGVSIPRSQVLGQLTALYIPPSNYFVQPVLSYQVEMPDWIINKNEVARIFDFFLGDLINNGTVVQGKIYDRLGKEMLVPGFQLEDRLIWGATAMILSELRSVIQSSIDLRKLCL